MGKELSIPVKVNLVLEHQTFLWRKKKMFNGSVGIGLYTIKNNKMFFFKNYPSLISISRMRHANAKRTYANRRLQMSWLSLQ